MIQQNINFEIICLETRLEKLFEKKNQWNNTPVKSFGTFGKIIVKCLKENRKLALIASIYKSKYGLPVQPAQPDNVDKFYNGYIKHFGWGPFGRNNWSNKPVKSSPTPPA